jgi:large subunit ribosomal protein L15
MLSLHTITKAKGSAQKNKRVGRGNASGHGTYSTRGLKGQKSRSGVSGLKKLGLRKQLLAIPKLRGFRSLAPKNQVVSVKAINRHFKDEETVSPATLFAKELIGRVDLPVKILGKEKLTVKVKMENVKMSAGVKTQIK